MKTKRLLCPECGAPVDFPEATSVVRCGACSHRLLVPNSPEDLAPFDYAGFANDFRRSWTVEPVPFAVCLDCGVGFSHESQSTHGCPFCGRERTHIDEPQELWLPNDALPFLIDKAEALGSYRDWLGSLPLAPGELKRRADLEEALEAIYLPCWCFSFTTTTFYTGERADEEVREAAIPVGDPELGATLRAPITEAKWQPASGVVWHTFEKVLIPATKRLSGKLREALSGWNLHDMAPYDRSAHGGPHVVRYDVDAPQALTLVQRRAEWSIDASIVNDIGGSQQRIGTKRTQYDQMSSRLLLVPIWLGAYRYRDKCYQFVVNGQSGLVQGEAPISIRKLVLMSLAGAIVLLALLWFLGEHAAKL